MYDSLIIWFCIAFVQCLLLIIVGVIWSLNSIAWLVELNRWRLGFSASMSILMSRHVVSGTPHCLFIFYEHFSQAIQWVIGFN